MRRARSTNGRFPASPIGRRAFADRPACGRMRRTPSIEGRCRGAKNATVTSSLTRKCVNRGDAAAASRCRHRTTCVHVPTVGSKIRLRFCSSPSFTLGAVRLRCRRAGTVRPQRCAREILAFFRHGCVFQLLVVASA
ncbi:hypothetical protein Trydic_g10314 [Trypoxylus dichotomus]